MRAMITMGLILAAVCGPQAFSMGSTSARIDLPRTDGIEDWHKGLFVTGLCGPLMTVPGFEEQASEIQSLMVEDSLRPASIRMAITGGQVLDEAYRTGFDAQPRFLITEKNALVVVSQDGTARKIGFASCGAESQVILSPDLKMSVVFEPAPHQICGAGWPAGGWKCRSVPGALRTVSIAAKGWSLRYRIQSSCQELNELYKPPVCFLLRSESLPQLGF